MGGHGREFHGLMAAFDGPVEERFEDVAPDSLLACLQHDLLHLVDRGNASAGEGGEAPAIVDDRSIQVHACHGPMREIEVLQDQILDLLATHPDLEPREILVMTPDIETYAPYIQAVFGAPSDERHDLPFSIADRCLETASPLVEHFDLLLDLRGARFTVSEILALLEFAPLRATFGLDETDVTLAADLIDRVNIRWGLDGESKTRWQLPAVDANTWQHGLDRLILGRVMHPEPDRFFQHLLPADSLQGSEARVIGRLHALVGALGELGRALDRPRTIDRWHRRLTGVLTEFFQRDERWEYDFQVIERLLGKMHQASRQAAFEGPVDLDVVRAGYKRQLSRETYRGGFIAGGITFGALLPMRSIPAAVIALVGMNHDLFPRLDRPRSFDLVARDPRRGDRSRRSDDRYLFLEALISARRCLYISYTAFDPHDNAVQPPSVLVSELTDYLQDNYGRRTEDLVTTHRLQPFAPAYFQNDARLFSYNREQARAARRLNDAGKTRPRATWFLSSALPRCSPAFWDLAAEDLRDALHHPCRFLLERRMDLRLRRDEPLDRDREAFALDPLTRFQTGQWLTDRMLAGMTRREGMALLEARGVLPHGETGASAARRLLDDIAVFTDRIRPHVDASPRPAGVYRLALDGYLLSGRLANLYPEGPVFFRYSRAGGRALLDAWIQHLIYCRLASEEGRRGTTILICRDEMRRFRFVDDHHVLVGDLLDLYFEALHSPLPIFPQSTAAFGRQCFAQGKSASQALAAARRVWEGSFTLPGDQDDPYVRLGFRGRDPWTQGFTELAERLFAPLFAHSETFL
jgi:exodeoxyribonuclease V gamma subunit